ncbi:MAG TPA: adenosylcobinamide-GDP ribazoletransferase [Solirubrobacteraceae bacterium]
MSGPARASDRRPLDGAALALTFLTVIPIRPRRGAAPDLGRAAVWFPAIGALVGLLAGAVRAYSAALFGPAVASVLALVVLVAVTGALHQDGLADCADGLGVHGDRERRLAVMRDAAIGAFGTLALLGWALLLLGALATLSDHAALRTLVTAAMVARWAALVHASATAPARPDGLGASFAVARAPLVVASAATIVAAVLIDGPVDGLASVAAGAAVAGAASAWARRAVGGRTGDTLGATVALAEVAVCLTLLAFATA